MSEMFFKRCLSWVYNICSLTNISFIHTLKSTLRMRCAYIARTLRVPAHAQKVHCAYINNNDTKVDISDSVRILSNELRIPKLHCAYSNIEKSSYDITNSFYNSVYFSPF